MSKVMDWVTPAGIGAGAAILIQVATLLLQRRKIKVDDDSGFRRDLMAEREHLVDEINKLSERINKVETENHELKLGQIKLQQTISLQEVTKARYEADIEALRGRVKLLEQENTRLEQELQEIKHENERLEQELKEIKHAQNHSA